MERENDEQLKKECVFHSYGRFANIRNIIDANRKENERFKVLDVGGRGNLMRRFLSNDDVFYLDPYVDSNDDNFIKGDGCSMPLENESFDWVVSADVFEHIPRLKRNKFIEENIRVAKCGVIIVAPFHSKEVHQAETNANENHKILFCGQEHLWLKEHLENGLPEEKEIEDFLYSHHYTFQKLHNNWLFLWQMLIVTEFFIDYNRNERINKLNQDFNFFYNKNIFPLDNAEPSYRKIYFIKKDEKLKDLNKSKELLSNLMLLELVKRRLDIVAEIDNFHRNIFQQKDSEIQQKDSEIQLKDQTIQKKERQIQKKNEEIESMKASNFWKLREKYTSLKKVLTLKK